MPLFLPQPSEEKFKEIEKNFSKMWNFPNCRGAIDGKHIRIVCPKNSGSAYYCYKDYFSTVLLALVDANYCFITVDVGSYGKEGDSTIFQRSNLNKNLQSDTITLPKPKNLPGTKILSPHVFVGDAAFALTSAMLKPFPESQAQTDVEKARYNYRLCRARRTSENAFGILCQYFRVFFTPIACKIETVSKLVLASCILHNMLRQRKIPCPLEPKKGTNMVMPDKNLTNLAATGSKHASFRAEHIRQNFSQYFSSKEGDLKWQNNKITRTA
nr:protein ANTAGONIST OF LIKE HETEROCHROMATIN PROTEIN 1-like [Parasteatoda tepidariorum]